MRTTDSAPLQQLQDALLALTQVDPRDQSDESVRSALPALLTAFHQLAAVVSGVVGAFDARDLAQLDACRTAKTWLESFGRMTPNAASAWVKRARLLGELPALRAAALAGTVSADHLRRVFDLIGRGNGRSEVGQQFIEGNHGSQSNSADQVEHPAQVIDGHRAGQRRGP